MTLSYRKLSLELRQQSVPEFRIPEARREVGQVCHSEPVRTVGYDATRFSGDLQARQVLEELSFLFDWK